MLSDVAVAQLGEHITYTELDEAQVTACNTDYTDLLGAMTAASGAGDRRGRRAGHVFGCIGYYATEKCKDTFRRGRRAGHSGTAL
jgi:hypothetical protein